MTNSRSMFPALLPLLCLITPLSTAAGEFNLYGFIKADAKFAFGDLPFKAILDGNPGIVGELESKTQFSAQESRLGLTYADFGAKGVLEIDFAGSAQGNTMVSNSYSPRLRQAYINYQGLTVGQTWSTLVNPASFPESANLGGALVGEAMVRQAQVRYAWDNWAVALENPAWLKRSYDGSQDTADMAFPDLIVKYSREGQWGNVSLAGLGRSLPVNQGQEPGLGVSAAGVLQFNQSNQLKWQLHYGHLGRYTGTTAAADVFDEEKEVTLGGMLSLQHKLSEASRFNLYLGYLQTQVEHNRRGHMAINLFHDILPILSVGVELGHYLVRDKPNRHRAASYGESSYLQLTSILKF